MSEARAADGPAKGLKRTLGLFLLTAYGVGVTIGAGIYVLIGAVAGSAGVFAPASFLVAGLVAFLTALSFGELACRFPVAAGPAAYAEEAFHLRWLAPAIGLLILSAGMLSAGTILLGAAGYLNALTGLPISVGSLTLLFGLGLIAAYGIRESVAFAAIVTVIEVTGLIIVFVSSLIAAPALPDLTPPADLAEAEAVLGGIFAGALLAFFAFIGFEDMVHVAEEVESPEKTIPRAILLTLLISGTLYLTVAALAVAIVPPQELAASEAPLALVAEKGGVLDWRLISVIAIIAALNGILVQIIMGSRLIYGLADRRHLPKRLGAVHPFTRTPLLATLLIVMAVGTLASLFPLKALASFSSQITLTVFTLVNLSLLALKLRPSGRMPAFRVPLPVPIFGAITTLGLLLSSLWLR